MTVIVTHATTEFADDAVKNNFFDQIGQAIQDAPSYDIIIILTDTRPLLGNALYIIKDTVIVVHGIIDISTVGPS